MLSFFQKKLGKVLGTIVGYIPNLIVSPILLVISAVFQPWFWLDLTWGILSTSLGFVSAKVVAPGYMDGWGGAYSLGPVLTGWSGFSDWQHEYGHTWQNRVLGPLYLFVVAIPSLISAISSPASHNTFYTEKWADNWSSWA